MDGKWWKVLILLVLGFSSYGQYVYTYTDPCTGILNAVTITQPSGSVTLFYAGQYNTFTQAQLQAGAFELWVQSVNATAPPGSNPCAGAGGTLSTGSNATTGTNTATNISGIVGVAANIGGSLGSGAASSTGGATGGSTSNNDNNGSGSNNSTGGSTSTGGSGSGSGSSGSSGSSGGNAGTGGGSGGSTGSGGGSGSTGGSGGSGSGGGATGGSGGGQGGDNSGNGIGGGGDAGGVDTGTNTGGTSDGGTDAGAVGGTENTSTASGGDSESSSSEGDGGGGSGGGKKQKSKQEKIGRGALIGAGDFVIVRNSSDIKQSGMDNFKFNMSLTHVNTKQTFIKGINFNFTTGENVLNSTLYGSYKKEGFMGVFSNSTMTNFKTDIFNTTTALVAQKVWIVTPMLGTNFTLGKIGDSDFQNWSIVAGGYTNFKGIQALSGNVMLLGIYSPYIFYYEGQWYKSGLLFVPLANVDFKITSTFKWSISFGGAYQYNADILNYQLSTGTKIML
jgi:hypothetical protein